MPEQIQASGTRALLEKFFSLDDLQDLTSDAGTLLGCPILVVDDAFHVSSHFGPLGFSDTLFRTAVNNGEISYEVGAMLSRSEALTAGRADFFTLDGSPYRRRFSPLISAGVRLGYLICIETDGHLQQVPEETWRTVESVLAKQLFIETSRQDKPFETAEDVLMHLLDEGFSSASYFRLQAASTYLADFHPTGFALFELTAYHDRYIGKHRLREEILARFPDSHPFLFRGDVFIFLHGDSLGGLNELADEFSLKIIAADGLGDLYELPQHYKTAHEALELITGDDFHGGSVCTVAQLRTVLMLKSLECRRDLIPPQISALADHDRDKGTQYCETLYHYLCSSRSLKRTCDAMFTHRNTVLYRIRRMQEDFALPLDEPYALPQLLLGVSMVLFEEKGADYFLPPTDMKGQ